MLPTYTVRAISSAFRGLIEGGGTPLDDIEVFGIMVVAERAGGKQGIVMPRGRNEFNKAALVESEVI